jgi:hypothetical protein
MPAGHGRGGLLDARAPAGRASVLGVCLPGTPRGGARATEPMTIDEEAMRTGIAVHCAVAERFS